LLKKKVGETMNKLKKFNILMSNKQDKNKHQKNKSNHQTTTKGARGHKKMNHGKGKRGNMSRKSK
jgi:hypothetical protein